MDPCLNWFTFFDTTLHLTCPQSIYAYRRLNCRRHGPTIWKLRCVRPPISAVLLRCDKRSWFTRSVSAAHIRRSVSKEDVERLLAAGALHVWAENLWEADLPTHVSGLPIGIACVLSCAGGACSASVRSGFQPHLYIKIVEICEQH